MRPSIQKSSTSSIMEPLNLLTKSRAFHRFKKSPSALVGLFITGMFLLMAVMGPFLVPHDPYGQSIILRLSAPSMEHWMGTDELGRDLFSRIVYGARITLVVSIGSTLLAAALGTVLGAMAALVGGILGGFIMRFMEILLAMPGVLLAVAIVAALGPSLTNLLIAIAVNAVPTFARLAFGSTVSVREEDYVSAARSLGGGQSRILFRHILPNITTPIFVQVSLTLATAVLSTAGLSFLGLGAQPPTPEWGRMLSEAQVYMRSAPLVAVFPGAVIFVTVIGVNLLGDGLRDALDPRGKE